MFLLDHNSFFTRAAGAPAAAGRLTGWTVGPWWSGRAYRWGPRWWSCRRLWSPCSACRQTSCPRPTHLRLRLAGENFIIKNIYDESPKQITIFDLILQAAKNIYRNKKWRKKGNTIDCIQTNYQLHTRGPQHRNWYTLLLFCTNCLWLYKLISGFRT